MTGNSRNDRRPRHVVPRATPAPAHQPRRSFLHSRVLARAGTSAGFSPAAHNFGISFPRSSRKAVSGHSWLRNRLTAALLVERIGTSRHRVGRSCWPLFTQVQAVACAARKPRVRRVCPGLEKPSFLTMDLIRWECRVDRRLDSQVRNGCKSKLRLLRAESPDDEADP